MSFLLVSTASSEPFATRLGTHLGVPVSAIDRKQFPDGESYLRFDLADRLGLLRQDVVIVGSTESAASLDEVYRLGWAATKAGARTLVLIIPYFGYSTMERAVRPGEVVAAKAVARQLSALPRAPRGNWILLMDLHSAGIVHYFEESTVALELYSEPKLVTAIERLGLAKPCLASADMGRAKWVASLANRLQTPVALIHKKRLSGSETRVHAVVGDVAGKDVVIYDDMIRTGSSLIQATDAYLHAGAASVSAVASHLVFPNGTVPRLEAAPLRSLIGTDTHPNHVLVEGKPRCEIVHVADLFAQVVCRLVW